MMRLFQATALITLILTACDGRSDGVVDPVGPIGATHVPGEPTTMHSVGVQLDGNLARVIWHEDPFNLGAGYTVEVFAGAACTGVNLVANGDNVSGQSWTQLYHLFIEVGPLAAGEYCARVKSNGLFSPPSFRTFITVKFAIGVANEPPEIGFDGPDEVDEGESAIFLSVVHDPDGDPLTIEWSIDGEPVSTAPSLLYVFPDDGTYEVRLTASDGKGGSAEATRSVAVANVAPSLLAATKQAPTFFPTAVPVDEPLEFAGSFMDPGLLDTHTLGLNCDYDGTPTDGTDELAVLPAYSGTCVWRSPGMYRVGITVSDDDGGRDEEVSDPVIVYLPGVGHVTGGGWIDSPAEACRLNPACIQHEGRASFGQVSKYRKGNALPEGNLTFRLLPNGFTFMSDRLRWLSVAGSSSWLEGAGRIDGRGDYEFILIAIDGSIDGSGPDRLRLRISDPKSGVVVYDNLPGEPLTASTALSGGDIAIHGEK